MTNLGKNVAKNMETASFKRGTFMRAVNDLNCEKALKDAILDGFNYVYGIMSDFGILILEQEEDKD